MILMRLSSTSIRYGLAMAVGLFALRWLETQYAIHLFPTELYIVVLAALFTAVGIWIGARLSGQSPATAFARNEQAIQTLGLTKKELEVLELLAAGGSNQQMAKQLFVSTSTIKTHLVHIYQKLDVSSRTQAIQKARTLRIIA